MAFVFCPQGCCFPNLTNTSASTYHVTTELGAADENRQLVPLASQVYHFSSRCLNPKAKKEWYLGSPPQWLHLEKAE